MVGALRDPCELLRAEGAQLWEAIARIFIALELASVILFVVPSD